MFHKEGRKAGKNDGIPAIRRGGLIPELPLLELERSGTELQMKDRSREYKEIQHYVLRTLGEIADIFDTKRLKTFHIEDAPRAPNGDLLRANDPQLIVWKSIMDNTLKEQMAYRAKAKQCFGVLIGQCGELMQARLQQQAGFTDLVVEGDPLKLLNLIERVFLEEFSHRESGHYVVNVLNTATAFANFRQKEHDDITSFYKAYSNVYATYKACGGHIVPRSSQLSGLTVEESREVLNGLISPDEAETIRLDRTEQAFLAVDFLLRLDTKRYGSLLQDLKNRMNAGRDEYPTTLYNAFVMASRYFEINGKTTTREPTPSVAFATSTSTNPSSHDSNNKRREKGKKKDKREDKAATSQAAAAHTAESKQCAHCGIKGHLMLECRKLQREIANFKEKKEKKDSAGAASVHLTVARDDDDDDSILHCGFHTTAEPESAQCFIETDLESTVKENANLLHADDILADNQATVSIFHNRRYLRNIRSADKHLKVHGIGGHLIATQVGDFGNFGQVYYHPKAVANILSFYELQRKYQIEYNNKIEDAFIVTTDKAKIKFVQKKGLYVYNPTSTIQSAALTTNATGVQQLASVDTVKANEGQYSKQNIQRAKAAQDLYIITRNSWTPIPMPNDVIELLNQRALTEHGGQVNADDLLGPEEPDSTERDPDDAPEQHSDDPVVPLQPLDNDRFIPREDPAPTNDDAPAAPTTEDHLAPEQHFDGRGDDGADLPDATPRGDLSIATPAPTVGPETQNIYEVEQSTYTPFDSTDLTPTRLFGDEDEVEDTSPAVPSATVLTHLSMNKALRSGEPAAVEAILAELDQLHTKGVFLPLSTEQLSPEDKRKAIDLLMFVKIKRDGRAKGRGVANGARQDVFSQQTETSSPTASQDTIMLSIAIDAMERRTVKSADIVGAYLHAKMENKVVLVMSNKISLLLISLFPQYQSFLQPCGRLFCILGRALYGCKESGLLFNKHLHKSLTSLGFQRNPYDRCCYNKYHGEHQVTIILHVDDLKLSCKDAGGVDAALDGLRDIYKEINVSEGPRLDYLGMVLDFSEDGFVTIDMTASINEILEEHAVEGTVHSPAASYLFSINKDAAHLSADRKKTFHTIVAKLLYLAKHGRPDILLPVCFLTTRVSTPTEEDEKKLHRVLRHLQGTRDIFLRISADEPLTVQAFVDASYAVHPDMRSHTGSFITLGRGAVFCKSSKQKLNVKSSTEAELVGLSDSLSQVFWSRNFLATQGYDMHAPAVVHQDNKSAIVLAEKGAPASSNTKHMDIRYFYVANRIERGEAKLVHTGTADMVADFFTKPLHGAMFEKMRALVMNIPFDKTPTSTSQGCDAQKT